ncbi:RICIN domain-containing protein [uncultured Clostridium sp.]|jgi:hypothetical protein|uniref:RICIN domain-containing protein n=1 Tax=uncultured Clostridium sp. TaxID=59620 RepID=UPI00262C1681|nr:RICIN domain-containing protein [uncultured Clostridium sp.]
MVNEKFIYKISPLNNQSLSLSHKADVKMELWNCDVDQLWQFKYVESKKAYEIISLRDYDYYNRQGEKVLSYMGDEQRGFFLVISADASDAHYWKVFENIDGSYMFINLAFLNSYISYIETGTENLEAEAYYLKLQSDENILDSFKLIVSEVNINDLFGTTQIDDGLYKVALKINHSKVWERTQNASVAVGDESNNEKKRWRIIYDTKKDGYKILSAEDESLAITYDLGNQIAQMKVFTNEPHQYWEFIKVDNKTYKIRNKKYPGFVVTVDNSNTGSDLKTKDFAGITNNIDNNNKQKFIFEKVGI